LILSHPYSNLNFRSSYPLATTNPTLFELHLWPLLGFLPAFILPSADPGPMPTVAKPFPRNGSFTYPPLSRSSKLSSSGAPMEEEEAMAMDEEREDVRRVSSLLA